MKIGLFFGSFNPVHHGHLLIAATLLEQQGWDQVWMVLSPQNPFKQQADLLPAEHRLQMLHQALRNEKVIRVCTEELYLSQPSYTIDTMNVLSEKFPDFKFHIIIGSDHMHSLYRWKDIDQLLNRFEFHVYNRSVADHESVIQHPNINIHALPILDISATEIRQKIAAGMSITGLVHPGVTALIQHYGWYQAEL
jgi:nicotinate-nucleotide adenylyltransferase